MNERTIHLHDKQGTEWSLKSRFFEEANRQAFLWSVQLIAQTSLSLEDLVQLKIIEPQSRARLSTLVPKDGIKIQCLDKKISKSSEKELLKAEKVLRQQIQSFIEKSDHLELKKSSFSTYIDQRCHFGGSHD